MANAKKKPSNPRRFPFGVFQYESTQRRLDGRPDVCYYISYKVDGVKTTEKVGWKSHGYTPQIASELRGDRLRKARHGDTVKTQKEIRNERRKQNRTLNEIAAIYFQNRGGNELAAKYDRQRYNLYAAPLLGKRPIGSLSPFDMERIKKSMEGLADATIWGALEIIRRIVNYGFKTGICDPLGFQIAMPKRDNEVVEYLDGEQLRRLNEVLDSWRAQDVARMLKVAMLTGMRRGEIFKLQDEDIDFIQKIITLRHPKGGRTVSIPLSNPVAEILIAQKKWREQRYPESKFIFPGANGNMRVECKSVDRIKKMAKLPAKFRIFHGLRHHFAVTLASSREYTLA